MGVLCGIVCEFFLCVVVFGDGECFAGDDWGRVV